jgi:ketosteroid isomerase-like protein
MPDAPLRTTYTGFSRLQRSLASVQEAWDSMKIEEREIVQSDDVIVAVWRYHLRGHSGVELEVEQGWAYWIRNGEIWRIEQQGSKQEALEAVGLQG